MTGLIVLAVVVPALAIVFFWLRAKEERHARRRAEARAAQPALERTERTRPDEQAVHEFLAVVAHELRSPLSAIIGYQELLSDGLYGKVDDLGREGLERIGQAAHQLLLLTDGMEELGGAIRVRDLQVSTTDIREVLSAALQLVQRETLARNIELQVRMPAQLPAIQTDPERARGAIDLLLHAGIKLVSDPVLRLSAAAAGDSVRIELSGRGLDRHALGDPAQPQRIPELYRISSGATLRLAIARQMVRTIGGELECAGTGDDARIALLLPSRGTTAKRPET